MPSHCSTVFAGLQDAQVMLVQYQQEALGLDAARHLDRFLGATLDGLVERVGGRAQSYLLQVPSMHGHDVNRRLDVFVGTRCFRVWDVLMHPGGRGETP
jgi:hypothetical protein